MELVKITTPEQSDAEHRALVAHAEECLKRLKLPYRKMLLCGGDIGFSAQLCYDLEVWLPGQVPLHGTHPADPNPFTPLPPTPHAELTPTSSPPLPPTPHDELTPTPSPPPSHPPP